MGLRCNDMVSSSVGRPLDRAASSTRTGTRRKSGQAGEQKRSRRPRVGAETLRLPWPREEETCMANLAPLMKRWPMLDGLLDEALEMPASQRQAWLAARGD